MFGGADAFPGRGDLDQDPLAADASLVIQVDQTFGAAQGGLSIEGQARIDFGGDTPRNDLENFLADRHAEAVAGQAQVTLAGADCIVQQLGVARHGGGLEQQ
ncbi:hypothetical protein D9M68_709660 [compost metagenome]